MCVHKHVYQEVQWYFLLRDRWGRFKMPVCTRCVNMFPRKCFVSELLLASYQVNAVFLSLQINHLVARYVGSPICTIILAAMPITLSRRIYTCFFPYLWLSFTLHPFLLPLTVFHCWWHQEDKVIVLATL